jgi:CheY-like chemotaxis protein
LVDLIRTEFEPFGDERLARVEIADSSYALRPEIAPIFSLVIHELVTNAVKYGTLSNSSGTVSVEIADRDKAIDIFWEERGGPPVTKPAELGFGSTLIRDAIPHELQGDAQLEFDPNGVRASLHLPANLFLLNSSLEDSKPDALLAKVSAPDKDALGLETTSCLIVEDNFVIARSLRDQLSDLGVGQTEIAGSEQAALVSLKPPLPSFAILDVNLKGGTTSFAVADRLRSLRIPFFFVTGYGDSDSIPPELSDVLRLKKPAMSSEVLAAIARVLGGRR